MSAGAWQAAPYSSTPLPVMYMLITITARLCLHWVWQGLIPGGGSLNVCARLLVVWMSLMQFLLLRVVCVCHVVVVHFDFPAGITHATNHCESVSAACPRKQGRRHAFASRLQINSDVAWSNPLSSVNHRPAEHARRKGVERRHRHTSAMSF